MNGDIRPLMTRLPDPAAPASLAPGAMARIAREADREKALATPKPSFISNHRDRLTWLLTLAGLVIVLSPTLSGWLTTRALPDLTSWWIERNRLVLMPIEGPAVLLGLGFVIYLAGLFAPLQGANRR